MPSYCRPRIVVPQRPIQGGFDVKFETDPYDIDLKGIMSSAQYTDTTTTLNDRLRSSRSGAMDKVLLATGPLLVPLALWGFRHSNQTRRRKRLLKQAMDDFHTLHPTLLMRWNRASESFLTIERRPQDGLEGGEGAGAGQPIVQAHLASDVIAPVEPIIEPTSMMTSTTTPRTTAESSSSTSRPAAAHHLLV